MDRIFVELVRLEVNLRIGPHTLGQCDEIEGIQSVWEMFLETVNIAYNCDVGVSFEDIFEIKSESIYLTCYRDNEQIDWTAFCQYWQQHAAKPRVIC